MNRAYITNFLNGTNYDVRISGNARWIDQKITPDNVSVICDIILNYYNENSNDENNGNVVFSVKDIWSQDYSTTLIPQLFGKPRPDNPASQQEYDKFFGQPIKMLGYSGILRENRVGSRNFYTIINLDLIRYLSTRERNAIEFLDLYIEKVLRDSDWWDPFERFYANPGTTTYNNCRRSFIQNTINHTRINGELECGRIFTKVVNVPAYVRNTYGTERGRLSRMMISQASLMYNSDNFRDILTEKPRNMTRREYEEQIGYQPNHQFTAYSVTRAKRVLRDYNDIYRNSRSEVSNLDYQMVDATNMHHIFMESEFPQIANYLENIIALTPSQHYSLAHPSNNTHVVDMAFQHTCILAKVGLIQDNLNNVVEPDLYSFSDLKFVLRTGLDRDTIELCPVNDYNEIINIVNTHYTELGFITP